MPVSIRTAANYFTNEKFSWWNPTADQFQGCFLARTRRIDNFVSLWHRSSRREHIYIRPDACYENTGVFRHDTNSEIYLVSETEEADGWQGGSPYSKMVRAHKVSGPSGGKGQYYPVTVSGTGDNLGAVTVGPATTVYADTELRTVTNADDSVEIVTGEYLLAYSRNAFAAEGDFFYHLDQWYRVLEPYYDSGYHYCRAANQEPAFVTATFALSTTSTFNPTTGTFSAGTATTREVSVLIGNTLIDGRPSDNDLAEQLTLYVYLRHIGFTPAVGMTLSLLSKAYKVIKVSKHYENKQYELVVAP
jgi:hypothetical protein